MTDELTDTELDTLEAAALAAIPGYPMDADDCTGRWKPWFNFHGDPYVAEDDEAAAIVATVSTAPRDYGKARAEFMAAADPATVARLVAALRSERTQNAELVRLLEIEEGTSWMLATDRDDSLNEAEELRAELERERTQTLALRHSVPSLVREVRLSGAARSKPFTEALEEVERAWAALSTQEESK